MFIISKAQAPVAQFSADKTSGCAPLTVRFTDQSNGNPNSWNWDFGNDRLSSVRNPSITFPAPGTYSVTLVVRNGDGVDGETKTEYITVYPSPSSSFAVNSREGCLGSVFNFTDNSTDPAGNIVSWSWNFGDGTSSSQRNPSKTYDENGFYTISLTVTSSTGCTSTRSSSRYIRIFSGITNDFSFTQDSVCNAPYTLRFQNESAGPGDLTYAWNFGNGTTSTEKDPEVVFNTAGDYVIRLTTRSQYGCSEVSERTITVAGADFQSDIAAASCIGSPVAFSSANNARVISTFWDLGDGTVSSNPDISHTYAATGNYPVKLVKDFGFCKDSITVTHTVTELPAVNFTASGNRACAAPLTTNFTANAPGSVAWNWDFGNGNTSSLQNPSHTYNTTGNFEVSLTATNAQGCVNTETKPNFVQIRPPQLNLASIRAEGCAPYTYRPQPQVNTPVPVTSWQWNFGDGTTSSSTNPTKVYPNPGNYTVTLTVTTAGGCTQTFTVNNAVRTGTNPGTAFTISENPTCVGSDVQFTNTSTGDSDEWLWDFSDGTGTTSDDENPVYAFQQPGSYTVSFTATNNGCPQTATQTIEVRPPLAVFDFSVDCATGSTRMVTFTNNSVTDPALGAPVYNWDFGSVGSSSEEAPTVAFPSEGNFPVTLTVTNGACTHSVTNEVIIANEPAELTTSKTELCKSETFTIRAINSDPALITNYAWVINGGAPVSRGRSFETFFAEAGTYTISLTTTDINGCTKTSTGTYSVTVRGPEASFTTSNTGACVNTDLQFNSSSTSANATITSHSWRFGDGNSQNNAAAQVSHSYATAGNFRPVLIVRDSNGCTDTASLATPLLITSPAAGFTVTDTLFCPGLPLQFTDTSSGYNLSYSWQFGDGGSATEQNPTHTYSGASGRYNITLEVTDGFGCVSRKEKSGYINVVKPEPGFTVSDSTFLCPPAEVFFNSESSGYASLLWDFDNGNTSGRTNPVQFFNEYGEYNVKLYTIGYGGCLDSAEQRIRLPNPNSTTMTYSPVRACNELTVDFNITPPEDLAFTFSFGDGTSSDNGELVFSHYYGTPIRVRPAITFRDRQGCIATVNGPRQIEVIGAVPAFSLDEDDFCDEGTVRFTDFSIGNDPITNRAWNFGDGSTSGDINPTHSFTEPDTYPVTLTLTTQEGCVRSFSDTVRVYRTPAPVITTLPGVCVFDELDLRGSLAVPDTSINYTWRLSNNTNLNGANQNIIFNTPGTITATLEAANLLQCSGSTSAEIEVYPLPTITMPAELSILSGGSITIPAEYTENVNQWVWTPNTALSCINCAQPVAAPQFNTTYKIQVTDVNGCEQSGEINIVVICNNENFFIPNTFSPNNDGTNDVFYPRGKGIERIASMRVFNRWGQMVFERRNFGVNDPSAGWNGTFQGKNAPSDTYVYVVELICENAAIIPYKGNITLIR